MRVSAEHQRIMRLAIEPLDTPQQRVRYLAGDFARSDQVKDLDKRYRWDLYWHAVDGGTPMPDSTDDYTMDHLDTALRRIVKRLA
jgi:hypothetical protein